MEETIELTWYEAKLATEVGVNRCLSSWAKGSEHAAGYKPKDLFDTNIKAAASEMAVAKYLGIYWDGSVNTYKSQPDLAPDIEVRMSMTVPPCLIIDLMTRKVCVMFAFKICGCMGEDPSLKY